MSDLTDLLKPLEWAELANCMGVDPDLFFPERGASLREARAVCNACAVRAECLEYALENNEKFGVWGSLSERERRKIRKARWAAMTEEERHERRIRGRERARDVA